MLCSAVSKANKGGLWSYLVAQVPALGSKELLRRVAGSMLIMFAARAGHFIPLPDVNLTKLAELGRTPNALSNSAGLGANIMDLGIGPYINAFWLLTGLMLLDGSGRVFGLKDMGRTQEGQARLTWYTNVLALGFAAFSGVQRAIVLLPAAAARANNFVWSTMVTLVAGSSTLSFLGMQTNDHALGDGTSIIIAASILSGHAQQLASAAQTIEAAGPIAWWRPTAAVVLVCALVLGTAFVTQIEMRHPLVYYKTRRFQVAAPGMGPEAQRGQAAAYLPLRLMPSGVLPLMLTSFAFQVLPAGLASVWPAAARLLAATLLSPSAATWTFGAFVFLIDGTMVLFSSPMAANQLAEWMNTVEAGIRGLSPGPPTEAFLLRQTRLTRFWGCLALAALAVAAQALDRVCAALLGVPIGCQSMLLITGFLLSMERQVRALIQEPQVEQFLQRERKLLGVAADQNA